MKQYLVGGAVRDELMGKKPKDFDFTVVLDESDVTNNSDDENNPFNYMIETLLLRGYKIFLSTPEHLTVRARFPQGNVNSNLTADFVLARKEGVYTDGRRPDSVEVGTLYDDLGRRDFCMNAIAEDEDGTLIDPFGGQEDIENRVIQAVGNPLDRLTEDALRALRAIRFSVTLGFTIEPALQLALRGTLVRDALKNISNDRKMDELNKMFRHDTIASLNALEEFRGIRDVVFQDVNLLATLKQKGFK